MRPAADPELDLTGAIALVEGIPTLATVTRIAARGAIAQVYVGPDEVLRAVPLPGLWGQPAPTPVIAIGRAAGEGFLALCTAGPTAGCAPAGAWKAR